MAWFLCDLSQSSKSCLHLKVPENYRLEPNENAVRSYENIGFEDLALLLKLMKQIIQNPSVWEASLNLNENTSFCNKK